MTYAQSQGLHNIDWQYFLDHPPQTKDGWELAIKAAKGHTQNPGGCLPASLSRDLDGEIQHEGLKTLVRSFAYAISRKNIGLARDILQEINQRAETLLTKTQTP